MTNLLNRRQFLCITSFLTTGFCAFNPLRNYIKIDFETQPNLMDLCDRNGNSPAAYADKVLFVCENSINESPEMRDIIVARNRSGPQGEVCLKYDGCWDRYETITVAG